MKFQQLFATLCFAVLFCLSSALAKTIPSYAGRYRIVVHRVWNTSEDYKSTGKIWINLRTTQVRGRQLQYGWGQSYASIPLTDDMKIAVTLASRSNNQWKKNAFVLKFDDACSTGRVHAPSLSRLMFRPDQELTCPFCPMGLMNIKNQSFELSFPSFPVMPYGRYLFTIAVLKGEEVVGVGSSDCDIVPRV